MVDAGVEVDLVGAAGAVLALSSRVTPEELDPGAAAMEVSGAVESEAAGSDEGVELLKAVSLLCQRIRGAGEIQRGASDVEGIRRNDFRAGWPEGVYRCAGARRGSMQERTN